MGRCRGCSTHPAWSKAQRRIVAGPNRFGSTSFNGQNADAPHYQLRL